MKKKKHDLKYDDYKKYEVIWEGKDQFDDSFKLLDSDSFSHKFRFENNYGASVIKHSGSYGFEEDLFELAVLYFEPGDDIGSLTYSTSITNDVIGHLSNDEVLSYLKRIKELDENVEEDNNFENMKAESQAELEKSLNELRQLGVKEETIKLLIKDVTEYQMKKQLGEMWEKFSQLVGKYYEDNEE